MPFPETSQSGWITLSPDIPTHIVRRLLENAGVPVASWGQGQAKTVEHLWEEVQNGESRLDVKPDGSQIRREVNFVWVDVFHLAANGSVLALRELRQEYSDGRTRTRDLPASLGEKMKPGEHPSGVAHRAIQEELSIAGPETLYPLDSKTTHEESHSYPGLPTRYTSHSFVATIAPAAFDPAGHTEQQPDKTNYYGWVPADPAPA